jgi:hypothetical protein
MDILVQSLREKEGDNNGDMEYKWKPTSDSLEQLKLLLNKITYHLQRRWQFGYYHITYDLYCKRHIISYRSRTVLRIKKAYCQKSYSFFGWQSVRKPVFVTGPACGSWPRFIVGEDCYISSYWPSYETHVCPLSYVFGIGYHFSTL